jgi:RNA polymerase sigma-70 factor (ECF subfamily)
MKSKRKEVNAQMKDFDSLFQQLNPMVYRYLLSLSGDSDLAAELTSETFYQAYLHIDRFRGDCKVETWLCQIAKNAYFKEMKRRNRHSELTEQEDSSNFVDSLSDREQALQLHRQLHLLQEPYREVFMLRVFGELSFKEIAHVCGKGESWAKVTFYRAKDKLLSAMEEEQ